MDTWVTVVLTISSALISGSIATVITMLWQKRSKLYDSKKEIFRTMMSLRYEKSNEKNVEALNSVDIVFYKNQNVINAWKAFKEETKKPQPNDTDDKYLKLLEEISKDIGYKNINWEDIKNYYCPQGLTDKKNEENLLRSIQLQNLMTQQESHQARMNQQAADPMSPAALMPFMLEILNQPNGDNLLQKLIELGNATNQNPSE